MLTTVYSHIIQYRLQLIKKKKKNLQQKKIFKILIYSVITFISNVNKKEKEKKVQKINKKKKLVNKDYKEVLFSPLILQIQSAD